MRLSSVRTKSLTSSMKELVVLFLVIVLFIFTLIIVGNSSSEYKWDLAVLCIMKNEEMILEEWFEHNIWQGVQYFYVIDNGSTDGTKDIVQKYVDKGLASYYYLEGEKRQMEFYNKIYNEKARAESRWLAVIDIDEFMYNRKKGKTVRDYLNTLDYNEVGGARIHAKAFGSSGHEKQPNKVRESFLWRQKFVANETSWDWKTIANTKETEKIIVHQHETSKKVVKEPDEIVMNHYQIMSKEYFGNVKMTRGEPSGHPGALIRDWNYFKNRDHRDEMDDELVKLMN